MSSGADSTPPPGSGLNVIALISGGKDSLYSLLHCLRNGHNLVALANLYPPSKQPAPDQNDGDEEDDDIDSFMYQTIGHSVIPLYQSALNIPLYRAPIAGAALDTSRIYRQDAADHMAAPSSSTTATTSDETESLVPLLRRIMQAHPEANAVSAGAILSTYQRTRIENVAARLHLVPLAWLWMYPVLPAPHERKDASKLNPAIADAGLLEDMAAAGCEARIIKVASGGLDEGFLWGDVSSADGAVRRRIAKGMARFSADKEGIRGAVLGEGGEYESLALDGPGFLWKKRIEIKEREVKMGEGGVAFMRLKGARCVEKMGGDDVTPRDVRRPALLDERFEAVLDALVKDSQGDVAVEEDQTGYGNSLPLEESLSSNGGFWMIANLVAPEVGPGVAEQMTALVEKIRARLAAATPARETADIVFTTVLLRSMADFPHMNTVYNYLFSKPNPPARATVACGDCLPDGVSVMVSLMIDLGPRDLRHCLHVQSRSYWAPANIGPYSQAMSIPLKAPESIVYIAGQIPLEPASMEMVSSREESWFESYVLRAVLALQHLWRIGAAMQVSWWLGATAFITGEHTDEKAQVAWRLWEIMHRRSEEEEVDEDSAGLDAWDIKYGGRGHEQSSAESTPSLPNFEVVQSDILVPPFLAIQVAELPRGSDIEWQGLGCQSAGLKLASGENETRTTTEQGLCYTGIEIHDGLHLETHIQQVRETYPDSLGVLYTAQPVRAGSWPGQVVPCRSVWGQRGRRLVAGIMLQRMGS